VTGVGNDPELVLRLGVALALCFCIGLEREVHQKSAGLRTHSLVGLGAAVAMMVSKYGFADLTSSPAVSLDPSRVAAQIVSGIGFIGAGIIFVKHDSVRGLTTAGSVWLTAMVGMACGAGMYVLAAGATAAHFVVISGYPAVVRLLPASRWATAPLKVTYLDGRGVLRDLLAHLTAGGYSVKELECGRCGEPGHVVVTIEVVGGNVADVVEMINHVDGVLAVQAGREPELP